MEIAIGIFACLAFVVGLIVASVIVCWIVDRITLGPPPTPKELAEVRERLQKRLLSPQWPQLEEYFGAKIPDAVRSFYADRNSLLQTDFDVVPPDKREEADFWMIQTFEPADLEAVRDSYLVGMDESPEVAKHRFPFASDGFFNYYFIEIQNDPSGSLSVFFLDHDGGGLHRVADSFADFVNWERRFEYRSEVAADVKPLES